MNDVFISYSRRDKAFTQKLFEALKGANRQVWADWDSIPAASDWDAEIKEGIEQTESVLFVLSPEWIKSNECRKEMVHAVNMGKRLFPILYLPVDPKEVPPELAKINWVYMRDMDDFDKAFQTLCEALDTDLEWVKTHTRIQVRAVEWDKKKRDHSFVLRGKDLAEGEQFLSGGAHKEPEPTLLQGEYILASRKDANRRQRLTLTGVSAALIISIVLGIVALFARQAAVAAEKTAVEQRDRAVSAEATAVSERDRADLNAKISFSREISSSALNSLQTDPERSILLALQAYQVTKDTGQPILPETESALRQALQASRLRYILHADPKDDPMTVASSPDGSFVATGSYLGIVKVWKVWEVPNPSLDPGVYAGSLWVEKAFDAPKVNGQVYSIAFSPDSKMMAVVESVKVFVYSTDTGKELFSLVGHGDVIREVVFSHDGKLLVTASDDGMVKIWDIASQSELRTLSLPEIADQPDIMRMSDQPKVFKSVDISPDDRLIASARNDGQIYVSDAKTGVTLYTIPTTNIWNLDVAFSPDGKTLAWSDHEGHVAVMDLASRSKLFETTNHKSLVEEIAFSPDGSLLASAGSDNKVVVIDSYTGSVKYSLLGDTVEVLDVAFSPDGKYLVSVNNNNETKFWDASISTIAEAGSITAQQRPITGLKYNSDGTQLATSSDETTAHIWPSDGSDPVNLENEYSVFNIAFSPDGTKVAAGSWDAINIFDSASGNNEATIATEPGAVFDVDFSPDGALLSGALTPNRAMVWDWKTKEKKLTVLFADKVMNASGVAFSPDGKLFAASSTDYHIKVVDVATGKTLYTQHQAFWETSVSFSPDSKKLLSASYDNTAVLWDAATGDQLISLRGHTAGIDDAVFSPDGARVATASADGTAKVWDAATGGLLFTISPNAGAVTRVAFSPDGKTLAVGAEDGIVRFYFMDLDDVLSLALTRITRSLTPQECELYLHEASCPDTIAKPQILAAKPINAVLAQPYIPEETIVSSGLGSIEVTVEFINKSAQTLKLYWMTFDGEEQIYDDIAPNATYTQGTYNTHVWRVRDADGKLILEYTATELPNQVIEIAVDLQVKYP